jgi:hypothetical protein
MWSKAGRFMEGLDIVGVLQLKDKYQSYFHLHVVYFTCYNEEYFLYMLLYLWVFPVNIVCIVLLLFLHYVV